MRVLRKLERPAFTLIELLVVIALIAVLVALGAGAWFRVKASQMEKATNTTLSVMQSQFDQQWKAESDQAKQDLTDTTKFVGNARALADNDSIRTKVVWTKLRQKIAFPQNFWEVLVWAPAASTKYGVAQNSAYRGALAGISQANVIDPNTATAAQYEQLHMESAALLYLALTQPRRGQGSGFNPVDHVGPHAIGDVTLYGRHFKVFIDSWQRPIAFIRWPFSAAAMDLNGPPFVTVWGGIVVDPTDPERRLQLLGWNTQAQTSFSQDLGHPLPPQPVNLTPVIFSGGRDRDYGVDIIFTRLGAVEDDNIYGYRSRSAGGK
jgi:prepilin-type N-terminal cleavage/methylation domain-containing protein